MSKGRWGRQIGVDSVEHRPRREGYRIKLGKMRIATEALPVNTIRERIRVTRFAIARDTAYTL